MATKTLAAAAAVALSLAGSARADTVRTWYNDGNFTVSEVADPTDGSGFCAAVRGNPSISTFSVFAAPNFIAFDLLDRTHSWTPGQVVLTIDGRTWTATATVNQKYPDQLWIQPQVGTTQLKSFVSALYTGITLTVAGHGRPQPFSYQISLAGSYAALDATRLCVDSLTARTGVTPPAPAPVRPTAPAVQRYI